MGPTIMISLRIETRNKQKKPRFLWIHQKLKKRPPPAKVLNEEKKKPSCHQYKTYISQYNQLNEHLEITQHF